MKEFIIDLYRNPKFPLYAGIVIAVLASLFIIIYLIAKKDKKKIEETQALKLQELQQQKQPEMSVAYNPAIPPEVPACDVGTEKKEEVPKAAPVLNAPSIPNEIKPNPETEIVPVINPEDIPDTPKEAMPGAQTIKPSGFDPHPNIQPVMPEETIENIRKINSEIEKDLTVLENTTKAPNVAPVEILSDTLDVAPPTRSPQVFSSVNPPKQDNIDTL